MLQTSTLVHTSVRTSTHHGWNIQPFPNLSSFTGDKWLVFPDHISMPLNKIENHCWKSWMQAEILILDNENTSKMIFFSGPTPLEPKSRQRGLKHHCLLNSQAGRITKFHCLFLIYMFTTSKTAESIFFSYSGPWHG